MGMKHLLFTFIFFALACSQDLSGQPLRVLSYNTHLFYDSVAIIGGFFAGKNITYKDPQRSAAIVQTIISSGAHIVGVQEVWAISTVKTWTDALKSTYPYIYSPKESAWDPRCGSGLLVASKFPLTDVVTYRYKYFENPEDAFARKGVVIANIQLKYQNASYPITFAVTHAGTQQHKFDFGNLRELATQLAPSTKTPMIVVGDFNAHAERPKDYAIFNPIFQNLGCVDVFPFLFPEKIANQSNSTFTTWGARNTLEPHFNAAQEDDDSKGERIDFQYCRPTGTASPLTLTPKDIYIPRDWRRTIDGELLDLSDHYPVVAEYLVSKK